MYKVLFYIIRNWETIYFKFLNLINIVVHYTIYYKDSTHK